MRIPAWPIGISAYSEAAMGDLGTGFLRRLTIAAAMLASAGAVTALADEPLKIGLVTTLSGPQRYAGGDIRDGFNLAVTQGEGKLGGVPVQVLVEDDGMK